MDKAEQPIEHVCTLTEPNHVRDLEKRPAEFNLGTYWSEWPNRKAEIQLFVKADSKRYDIVNDTDRLQRTGLVGNSQSSQVKSLLTKTVVLTETLHPVWQYR